MEVVARLGADKGHQVRGVRKIAAVVALGQIAAQSHQALDAHGFERGELRTHGLACGVDAGEMRGSGQAFTQNFTYRLEGAFLCGATGTKGDGAKSRLQGVELLAH